MQSNVMKLFYFFIYLFFVSTTSAETPALISGQSSSSIAQDAIVSSVLPDKFSLDIKGMDGVSAQSSGTRGPIS